MAIKDEIQTIKKQTAQIAAITEFIKHGWHLEEDGDGIVRIIDKDTVVATMNMGGSHRDPKAQAKIMVKSPALYAALDKILAFTDPYGKDPTYYEDRKLGTAMIRDIARDALAACE